MGLRKQAVEKVKDPEDHNTYLKITVDQLKDTIPIFLYLSIVHIPQSVHFGSPLPLKVIMYYRNNKNG